MNMDGDNLESTKSKMGPFDLNRLADLNINDDFDLTKGQLI